MNSLNLGTKFSVHAFRVTNNSVLGFSFIFCLPVCTQRLHSSALWEVHFFILNYECITAKIKCSKRKWTLANYKSISFENIPTCMDYFWDFFFWRKNYSYKSICDFQIPLTDSANFFERFCTSFNWSFAEVKEIAIYTRIIDNQI